MGKKEKGERGGGGKTDHGDEGKPRKAKDRDESGGNDDTKRDQKLQAILLADSFTRTFRPVTWETPKVLLPLVNVPMLEYTIEFLAQNGVEELFMVCVWHADFIQRYVNNSKWPSTITVRCINSASCLSAGDALRELDSLGLIRSDPFILISGDVISNMDLKKAIGERLIQHFSTNPFSPFNYNILPSLHIHTPFHHCHHYTQLSTRKSARRTTTPS